MPRFSIITVVYNAADSIASTLDSVIAQNVDLEHLIIDGGSSDGTLDILHNYPHQDRLRIVSESDNGIYDAMNKGLRMACGQIIGILNADDFYANDQILCKVHGIFLNSPTDSCYGDLAYVKKNNVKKITRYWRAGPFHRSAFYSGWMPPHPTFFVKREVYEKHGGFNLSLGSAADYELMLRFLVKYGITTRYIPELMIKMRAGGASNASIKNRLAANRMDRKAWRINQLRPLPWTLWAKPARKIKQFFPRSIMHPSGSTGR